MEREDGGDVTLDLEVARDVGAPKAQLARRGDESRQRVGRLQDDYLKEAECLAAAKKATRIAKRKIGCRCNVETKELDASAESPPAPTVDYKLLMELRSRSRYFPRSKPGINWPSPRMAQSSTAAVHAGETLINWPPPAKVVLTDQRESTSMPQMLQSAQVDTGALHHPTTRDDRGQGLVRGAGHHEALAGEHAADQA